MSHSYKNELLAKFTDRSAIVAVVGLGYVGLPLVLSIAEAGFRTIGLDIDSNKVALLRNGQTYLNHIRESRIQNVRVNDKFEPSDDFTKAADADVLILCVPTPLNKYREPDLSFIKETMDALLPLLHPGQLICLESTTYPGTTEEELLPKINELGFAVGTEFFLVYSPEREDPGNKQYASKEIPKVVSGLTENCLEIGISLYSSIFTKVVSVSSVKAAEMTKLLENIYRAVNIGLVNEMKIIADKMDIDIWEVIDAAATKPFGFTPFYPGPGLGGHCIPIDPFYLTWKAREYDVNARFIELAGEINTFMPTWVLGKLSDELNKRGKSIKGAKILILGLAYKKNVDDVRESPAIKFIRKLQEKEANVVYSDPYIPNFPKTRNYKCNLKSVSLTPDLLKSMDCVLIATDHDEFDYKLIQESSSLILDSRGRFRSKHDNVIKC